MASQWYCKVLGRQLGPVSFQDLAEMVRAGTLSEEDPVCRKGAHEWTPARDVIGLFRAASRPPVEEAPPPEPEPPPAEPKRPVRRHRWLPRVGRRTLITTACTVVLVVLAGTAVRAWISRRRETFPQPYGRRRPSAEVDVAELARPKPTAASAPGLDMRRPALIPGLEKIDPGFAPCLTADLCTIVFSAQDSPASGYDLYLAKRRSVGHPFEEPELIEACATRQAERFAALSPDGLQLVFTRSEDRPQFFYTKRPTGLSRFGEPAPLPVPWVEKMNQQLERAQFCDASHLALSATDYGTGKRSFLFAVHDDEGRFGPGGKVAFRGRLSSQFFIAASGLRAYYADRKGISVTARRSTAESFQGNARILESPRTGPIKGPIWVAPQEDVIFYCSPGPADPDGSARRLWMIRF